MLEQIKAKILFFLKQVPPFINKYRYIIGGVFVVVFFSITVFRIDSLSSPSLDQDTYNQGLLEQKKVIFDEDAIDRINKLDERTVNPTENIDEGRNNPF